MPTHIRRFLVRFAIVACVDTILVLCLISGIRLWHVRNAATIAAKYAEAGKHAQIIRVLRLAHRWAPAYPAFSDTVAELHAHARRQIDPAATPPEPPERSFTASIPLAEKVLIPTDMLIDLFYRKYRERKQADTGTAADATGTEFRADPDEQAARPAIALHNPLTGQPSSPETPPSPSPADTPAYDPDAMWGTVSTADAPLYDSNGRKIRDIPAGSLIDVQEVRSTPSGDVVVCSVRSRHGSFNDVILRRADVELYMGYPLAATTKERRLLGSKRGEILGAIKSRQAALEKAASNRNPHQDEYRDVLRQYKAINDESKQLKEQYEKATGNQRMELANRLRTLKNDQFVLMPKYRDLKQKKEDWERRNQDNTQNTANDPQLRQLNQQLEQIDKQLGNG